VIINRQRAGVALQIVQVTSSLWRGSKSRRANPLDNRAPTSTSHAKMPHPQMGVANFLCKYKETSNESFFVLTMGSSGTFRRYVRELSRDRRTACMPQSLADGAEDPTVAEYVFEVMLRAVVRVRATNKEIARTAVSSLLSSPGRIQIDLANQSNAAVGRPAMVTDVDLVQESDPKPR
jgi:hypothetical protein